MRLCWLLFFLTFLYTSKAFPRIEMETVTGGIACRIFFAHTKTDFNKKEVLNKCVNLVPTDMIQSIEITGSASLIGNKDYNQRLSKRRANVIMSVIKKTIPQTIPVQIDAIGANSRWQRSTIVKLILKNINIVQENHEEIINKNNLKILEIKKDFSSSKNTQTYEIKENKSTDPTGISIGGMININSNYTKYAQPPIYGFEVSVNKVIYHINSDLSFYPAFTFNSMSGERNENNTQKRLRLIDYSINFGLKYNIDKHLIPFVEAGLAYGHHTITTVDNNSGAMFIYESNQLLFSNQFGALVPLYQVNDYALFFKAGIRSTIGRKKSYDSVNLNAWSPSVVLSLGVDF